MGFAKLDDRILNSTIWEEDLATRIVFVTAICMARPITLIGPREAIDCLSDEPLELQVPAGFYGFVDASASGIIHQARVDREDGAGALRKLQSPDRASSSKVLEGRRLLHVEGGFILVNFNLYRDKDFSTPRVQAFRKRQKQNDETG
jgi:hypothetical protein